MVREDSGHCPQGEGQEPWLETRLPQEFHLVLCLFPAGPALRQGPLGFWYASYPPLSQILSSGGGDGGSCPLVLGLQQELPRAYVLARPSWWSEVLAPVLVQVYKLKGTMPWSPCGGWWELCPPTPHLPKHKMGSGCLQSWVGEEVSGSLGGGV